MKRLFEVNGQYFEKKDDARAERGPLIKGKDDQPDHYRWPISKGPDHWRYGLIGTSTTHSNHLTKKRA